MTSKKGVESSRPAGCPDRPLVRIEFECQSTLPGSALVFNHLLNSVEFECRGKCTFSPTSFDHSSPHIHCLTLTGFRSVLNY